MNTWVKKGFKLDLLTMDLTYLKNVNQLQLLSLVKFEWSLKSVGASQVGCISLGQHPHSLGQFPCSLV